MPEALAIVAVFLVAIVVYVVLWVQSRNPALYDPRREQARLEQHVKWLEERLVVAHEEEWGSEMVSNLEADLTASVAQLTQLRMQSQARAM